ncbi:glycine cleavage system transcriptional repressor [Natronospira proteinivora]|uniref:Glycine cleavage system transcriptional repressor n=1 Tax=Natronospira proteinivora TaxID=1807133 RepID=A0ABT1G5A1_9GAMM|nr:ACT domain-containing protein [Natronospira proteinivora]MCP1726484.1 glycine cleavage system transcriptional repressor [Natronospira proteinivora]
MTQSLIISALGSNRPGLLEALTRQISQSGCSVNHSRGSLIDGHILFVARLTGSWDTLARVEAASERLERELGMAIQIRRVEAPPENRLQLPYTVDIVARDRNGTLNEVLGFFSQYQIEVAEVVTQSYVSDHTDTPMATIQMTVHIPDVQPLTVIRDQFMELCDRLNLDGLMEPIKH